MSIPPPPACVSSNAAVQLFIVLTVPPSTGHPQVLGCSRADFLRCSPDTAQLWVGAPLCVVFGCSYRTAAASFFLWQDALFKVLVDVGLRIQETPRGFFCEAGVCSCCIGKELIGKLKRKRLLACKVPLLFKCSIVVGDKAQHCTRLPSSAQVSFVSTGSSFQSHQLKNNQFHSYLNRLLWQIFCTAGFSVAWPHFSLCWFIGDLVKVTKKFQS